MRYAIMKEVEELTGGTVRLSIGTLYGIIKRLPADGLIRETGGARPGDERRRSDASCRSAKVVARAEAARLEQTIAIARRKPLFRRSAPYRAATASSADCCGSSRRVSRRLRRRHDPHVQGSARRRRARGVMAHARLWIDTVLGILMTAPREHWICSVRTSATA